MNVVAPHRTELIILTIMRKATAKRNALAKTEFILVKHGLPTTSILAVVLALIMDAPILTATKIQIVLPHALVTEECIIVQRMPTITFIQAVRNLLVPLRDLAIVKLKVTLITLLSMVLNMTLWEHVNMFFPGWELARPGLKVFFPMKYARNIDELGHQRTRR